MIASIIGIIVATTISLVAITMKFYMGGCCNINHGNMNQNQTVNEKSKTKSKSKSKSN